MSGAEPVLLGLLDQPVGAADMLDFTVSKIGGQPVGLPETAFAALECGLCKRCLTLVVQIYCPLGGSPYHRTLYMFACLNRSCWNNDKSWVVIRSQVLQQDTATQTARPAVVDDWGVDADSWDDDDNSLVPGGGITMATTDWCEGADDWGDVDEQPAAEDGNGHGKTDVTQRAGCLVETHGQHSSDSPSVTTEPDPQHSSSPPSMTGAGLEAGIQQMALDDDGPDPGSCIPEDDLTTQLQRLKENMKHHGSKIEATEFPAENVTFNAYYLQVTEELYYSKGQCLREKQLLAEYAARERVDVGALLSVQGSDEAKNIKKSHGGGEGYEKGLARHGDLTFQRFHKRLSLCPQQVVRYNYGGDPLPLVAQRAKALPCEHCGADRVFELQLLPALVSQLQVPGVKGPLLEFGSVMVYTCSRSCWSDAVEYRTEQVLVQADPDHHLFK